MTTRDIIAQAKRIMDEQHDYHLANYVLRDLPEIEDADLSDLAWAMHRETPSKNDVLGLIELLEKYLASKEE